MARLSWALFLIALLRIGTIVFADPLVGFANNFDFLRPASCTGLWQDGGVQAMLQPDLSRPVNPLRYTGETIPASCLRAADNVLLHAVTLWHTVGDAVDYREVGGLRLAVFLALYGVLLALVDRAAFRLALNAALVLTVSDATVTGYFNTLYQEATLLAGVFLGIGCCAAVWIVRVPRRPALAVLAGAVFAWVGLSKTQYLPYACTLLSLFGLLAWISWGRRRTGVALLGLALTLPAVALSLNDRSSVIVRDIDRANSTNTVMWAVLPNAGDPDAALRTLQLPPHCRQAIGSNWFMPDFARTNPCPEIESVSRLRLLAVFWQEPRTFAAPLANALLSARPFYPAYTGMFEEPRDKDAPQFQLLAQTSLPLRIAGLSEAAYQYFVAASLVAGVLALAVLGASLLKASSAHSLAAYQAPLTMVALGAGTVFYAFASSVFGDGYADFPKHASGVIIGWGAQAVGLAWLVLATAAAWHHRRANAPNRRPAAWIAWLRTHAGWPRWAWGLSWVLFALGLLRLGTVVLADPMVGYADNYDFVRPAVCTGLWQVDGFASGKPSRPVNHLVHTGQRNKATCLRSADNVLLHAVAMATPVGEQVDYRWLGGLRAAFAVALLLALLALVQHAALHVAINAAFAVGLSDITVSPYFNSLYQEASLLAAVAASLAACAIACTVPRARRAPLACIGVFALLWVAFTKQQYLPFALGVGTVLAFLAICRWRSPGWAVAIGLATLVGGLGSMRLNDARLVVVRHIQTANATNAFLGAVLPAASDPAAAARRLGLPERCVAEIGQTWYSPGYMERNPCPEVRTLRRVALLPLFVEQPRLFTEPMIRTMDLARPFYPTHVALFERPADASLSRFQALRHTSLPGWLAGLPIWASRGVLFAAMVLGVLAASAATVASARRARDGGTEDLRLAALWLVGLGGCTVLYAIASSAFGDGYFDVPKHASGSVVGLAAQFAGLGLLAGLSLSAARRRGRTLAA